MKAEDLEIGAVYRVGAGCGVPHCFRPITFRLGAVLNPKDSYRYDGYAWLRGEEIEQRASRGLHRNVLTVREIYVITAGLELKHSPRRERQIARVQAAGIPARRARNAGPAGVPKPRTSPETTTGRPR